MPVNAHPEYIAAEKEYHQSQTLVEKIEKLKKMISLAPSHKSAENLRAQLKTRLKKLLKQQEKSKKSGKFSKTGIKKEDMQAVIVGKTNSGKSSLIKILTNANPKISSSETKFTTLSPIVGMMGINSVSIQLIEIPAIDSDYYDKGIVYTADSVLLLITSLEELKEIGQQINTLGKKIIVFNKSDLLSEQEKRKLEANLKSKYKNYEFVFISCVTKEGLPELKEKIFKSFNKIRVYTKEPGKQKSDNPLILEPETKIKGVAEKIFKGFSNRVKETKIWGPSSKFPGQIVGMSHKLKDLDVVEFKMK